MLLGSYDARQAEADRVQALARYRRLAELRADSRVQLQSSRIASQELVLDENNLLPFAFLRTGDRLGRAVLKLLRSDGSAGTGFLVAPGIILTNNHVLPDSSTAKGTQALANYEQEPPPDPAGRACTVWLDPDTLFVTNEALDFSFCAVSGLDHLGTVPLMRDSLSVLPSESVNIIQHPRGRTKEVALQDNRVVKVDNVVVQYCCDTEPGSSGSPVFNNQWNLVALHHASVVVDGLGRPATGGDPETRYLNEGIRLSAIAVWLETLEADNSLGRDACSRLRSIFQGLDQQIGFFGALGRSAGTKRGPEAVVECYHARSGFLDLGYWNLDPLRDILADRLDTLGGLLAGTGIDAWFLPHCEAQQLETLRAYLEGNFRLEYRTFHGLAGGGVPVGVLVRRCASQGVEWLGGEQGHARLVLRMPIGAKRRGVPVQIVPMPREGDVKSRRRWIEEAIRETADRTDSELVLIGDGLTARSLNSLSSAHSNLLAAFGNDGGIAVLPGERIPTGASYVSPNLDLTIGSSQRLVVAHDRRWPAEVELRGRSRPLAIRLTFAQAAAPPPRIRADRPHPRQITSASPSNSGGAFTDLGEVRRFLNSLLDHYQSNRPGNGCEQSSRIDTENAPVPCE